MELHGYDTLLERARALPRKGVVAVAGAADLHAVEAALRAFDGGVAEPHLVGDVQKISELLRSLDRNPADFRISAAAPGLDEAETAVELIKCGEADFLMKGMVESSELLRPVVKKENGLRTGRCMSHLSFNSFPGYHKLICCTDGGMVTHPDFERKRDILFNAIDAFRRLGYEEPKAACICCKETLDEKLPETVDARRLRELAERGEFGRCAVEGPISYDIAMSAEIAAYKGFKNPNCGNFDILLVPDINSGNFLGKSWILHCGATNAGVIAGARIPIVMTSRGSTPEEKFLSLALAAVIAAEGGKC